MLFYQLFDNESSTYTYLLADEKTFDAVLIDSVAEHLERDLKLLHELGLRLKYVLDTHVHADHVTAAGEIRARTGALSGVAAASGVECADLPLKDGDVLEFGAHQLKVIATPGHTEGCLSYYCEGKLFTGDALLIRGCGRTDFQQGSSARLYASVTRKLFTLPPETEVYPGHDYKGFTKSTIAQEMAYNPRLGGGKTEAEFVKLMSEIKLAQPKKILEAVPANLKCGARPRPAVPQGS